MSDASSPTPRQSSAQIPALARLLAAVLVIGIGIIGLWQAGILGPSEDGVDTGSVSLDPADTSLATPAVAGLTVGLEEGQLAPDFSFSSFDGERLKLSDLRGRIVLLNFWATWCGPCRVELPDMENLLRQYGPDKLAVIAINNGERFALADRYLKDIQVELTAFGYDPSSAIARRYAVEGLPTSYFIDERGVVSRLVPGQLTKSIMETSMQELLAP